MKSKAILDHLFYYNSFVRPKTWKTKELKIQKKIKIASQHIIVKTKMHEFISDVLI